MKWILLSLSPHNQNFKHMTARSVFFFLQKNKCALNSATNAYQQVTSSKIPLWAQQKDWWVKYSLCKHDDLSLDPQKSHKSQVELALHTLPVLGYRDCEALALTGRLFQLNQKTPETVRGFFTKARSNTARHRISAISLYTNTNSDYVHTSTQIYS